VHLSPASDVRAENWITRRGSEATAQSDPATRIRRASVELSSCIFTLPLQSEVAVTDETCLSAVRFIQLGVSGEETSLAMATRFSKISRICMDCPIIFINPHKGGMHYMCL
jgi:hypothetical protein